MNTLNRLFIVSFSIFCLAFILSRISMRNLQMSKPDESPATQSGTSNPMRPPTVISTRQPQAFDDTASQILALLATGNPRDLDRAYQLLKDWTQRDPQAAADFVQSAAAATWRNDMMVIVAQTWTDMNVDDAEAWAAQLFNPAERNMVLGYVSFEEANTNPTRALQVLSNSAMSDDRRTIVVQNLANQWANQNLQPLYNWISTLPPGQQRDDYYERAALAQSYSDPAQAAAVVADYIEPGPIQDDAALHVVRQWGRQDMSAALSWVNQFSPGDLQDQAFKALSGNLAGAYLP